MKTVQFHRNKQELRNQLLSFLNVGKQKSKSKSKTKKYEKKVYNNSSKQKHPNRSQSRQKQLSPKDININDVQQALNNGLKIKLKLKKKAQNQTINNPLLQQYTQLLPLQQLSSKNINENIKKAIQKQLLSSFYKQPVKKQIDNRRTAYRQQSQDELNLQISQQQQSLSRTNTNNLNKKVLIKRNQQSTQQQQLTNNRQSRCSRIQKQRNNKMINSFVQQKQSQSIQQQSIKFIPEDEVYIPKSFVTFTVKRKEFRSSCDKKDILSNDKKQEQNLRTQMMRAQPYQYRNKQQNKQKIRSLSSMSQFQYNNSNSNKDQSQLQKKMAFYNRHNSINTNSNTISNNKQSSTSSLKKQSSLKTIRSISKEIEQIQSKQQQKQTIQIVETKSQKIYSVQNKSKARRLQTIITKENNIPLVKMTQSLYEGRQQQQQQQQMILSSKQQQKYPQNQQPFNNEPSLSLTSSLNYSTPIPSLQQSESKQLTINKLSTISKQPQQQRRIMHSLSVETTNNNDHHKDDDQSKLLRFSQQKDHHDKKEKSNKKGEQSNKSNGLLTTSLTKFRQYEQRKQQILRQKQSMKINVPKQIEKQNLKGQQQNQQFNDFDQIFLQSNQINIVDKLRLQQQKRQQQQNQQQCNLQQFNQQQKENKKQDIQKDFIQNNKNNNKNKQNPKVNIVTIPQPYQRPVQSNQSKIIKPSNELIENKNVQQQQIRQKQIKQKDQSIYQLPPPQLSINQSSIQQQSVSDFTPQPSLAEIKINDQPLLITINGDKNIINQDKQQPKAQSYKVSQQIQQHQQPKQQQKVSQQKHQLSLNQFQDYEFNEQTQIKNNNNNKKYLQFNDFPQWKYNDNRDNVPEQFINKKRQNQQKQVQIIPFERENKNQVVHEQLSSDNHIQQKQLSTSKINTNAQIQPRTVYPKNDQTNQQTINQIIRPKSTTMSNKVRLIQNIQLSSSSSSSQSSQTESDNDGNDGDKHDQTNQHIQGLTKQKQLQKEKTQYDQAIQNRYYSSSDQQQKYQQQYQSQHSKNATPAYNDKPQKSRQPTKLTLKKQTSMKKTFNNSNNQKTQQQKTKQKIIPLGIKVTKPKDLFPVLQDSQQWNYGSESVGEIERNSIMQKDKKVVNNSKKENQKFINQKKQLTKSFMQKHKQKDEQLDLLQKQFSQPSIIKSQKSKEIISKPNKIVIKKKSSRQQQNNNSMSDFSQSQQKNNTSNNLTQSLSDFSQDQSSLSLTKNAQVAVQNNSSQNNKNYQPSTKPLRPTTPLSTSHNNQLNEIKKQRTIVHDLKNHVNQLLKRISSQHSISAQQQKQQHNLSYQQKQKQNNSFLSNNNQPSIKPVSMSFESSQGQQINNDRESFVQQYEQENVKKSIVRSKNQQSRKSLEKKKNLFKKYQKDNNNKTSQQFLQKNPLFDFSDKNSSSDHQVSKQNKSSSVKKYSSNDSDQSLQYKKSHTQQQKSSSSNSQTSLQQKNKQDVLKQFQNLAKVSEKDFSKNKSYYLKNKEKYQYRQNKNVYKNDVTNEDLPILMPKQIKRVAQNNAKSVDRSYEQQGSSGQTINHKQLEIIPQSLYVTNAKNTTTTNQMRLAQMQPRQSLKNKKGLSVSKKMSSNSNKQLSSSSGLGKSFSGSQSEHNQSINIANQKGLENQFLWNFIMKK